MVCLNKEGLGRVRVVRRDHVYYVLKYNILRVHCILYYIHNPVIYRYIDIKFRTHWYFLFRKNFLCMLRTKKNKFNIRNGILVARLFALYTFVLEIGNEKEYTLCGCIPRNVSNLNCVRVLLLLLRVSADKINNW